MANSWFEHSTLWQEIQSIISKTTKAHLLEYQGSIHTPKATIGVYHLKEVEKARDYVAQIGDAIRIRFLVGLGDYVKYIYPHRHNLEFTLKKKRVAEGEIGLQEGSKIVSVRYKVIFDPAKNPAVGMSDLDHHSASDLNITDMVELYFQLAERSLEPFRIKTLSEGKSAFIGQKLEDITHASIANQAKRVLVDGKPCLDAIDIVPFDNQETIKNIVLPDGIRVTAIATYLQNTRGVYNFAIGNFYQLYRDKRCFFIYPLYNTSRFNENRYKAIFYLASQEKLPQADKTFIEEGKLLKVVCTANRLYSDSGEVGMMNAGSGYRMPDARSFLKKPAIIGEDGPTADRSRLNHEVIFADRDDGLNFAPMTRQGPSSNPYLQRSTASLQNCAQMDLLWENGDEDLIYPGMPCKVVSSNQGKIVEVKGTILFCQSLTSRAGNFNTQASKTVIRLTIGCEINRFVPDLPQSVEGDLTIPGEMGF